MFYLIQVPVYIDNNATKINIWQLTIQKLFAAAKRSDKSSGTIVTIQ